MNSIRTSLMLGCMVAMVGVLSFACVGVYRGARSVLFRQFDEALGDDARVIASTVLTWGDVVEMEFDDVDIREFKAPDGQGYLQIATESDSVLYLSPNLRGQEMPLAAGVEPGRPTFRWIQVGDVGRVRAVDLRFQPSINEEYLEAGGTPPPRTRATPTIHLVAAIAPAEVDAFLAQLRTLLFGLGISSALLAMLAITLVIKASLRPLNDLADEIGLLREDTLSSRVHVRHAPREMKPVVDQLNQLLTRLEEALKRERTFSADIAHELRTPLAGLRSTIEVMLSRQRRGPEYRETLGELLEIVRKVQAMAETLLYLARLESGQVEIERSAVDLGELTAAAWKPLVETAEARRLAVKWILARDVAIESDPILLEVAIRNLLENAVIYANEGGYVRVEVVRQGEESVVRVANSGSTVTQESVGDLLERFTRGDPSRGANAGSTGLGLALVSKIAAVLRCSMHIETRDGGEFCVTLSARGS